MSHVQLIYRQTLFTLKAINVLLVHIIKVMAHSLGYTKNGIIPNPHSIFAGDKYITCGTLQRVIIMKHILYYTCVVIYQIEASFEQNTLRYSELPLIRPWAKKLAGIMR